MPQRAAQHRPNRPAPRRQPNAERDERERFYDTARWRKLRLLYLGACPVCEECQQREAKHVDHRVPLAQDESLALEWDNLRALCVSCHSKKTRRDQAEGDDGKRVAHMNP